jgi:hypothetical protein
MHRAKEHVNLHPPFKHLLQLRMKSKLKMMVIKFNTMSRVKMVAWIKGDMKKKSKRRRMNGKFMLKDYHT